METTRARALCDAIATNNTVDPVLLRPSRWLHRSRRQQNASDILHQSVCRMDTWTTSSLRTCIRPGTVVDVHLGNHEKRRPRRYAPKRSLASGITVRALCRIRTSHEGYADLFSTGRTTLNDRLIEIGWSPTVAAGESWLMRNQAKPGAQAARTGSTEPRGQPLRRLLNHPPASRA